MGSRQMDTYERLLARVVEIPVVDTHEHLCGPAKDLEGGRREPILALITPYLISDLWSTGAGEAEIALLQSDSATTDEKWQVFHRLWERSKHTAFAKTAQIMLRNLLGTDEVTRATLAQFAEYRERNRDAQSYQSHLEGAGIRLVIADVLMAMSWEAPVALRFFSNPVLREFLENRLSLPATIRPVFPLPYFHLVRHAEFVDYVRTVSGSDITCLKQYEEAVFSMIQKSAALGVVALKDQSAYHRPISFDLPTQSEAERIFNKLLIDPRQELGWPEARPLDDYLFHQYMRFASELRLPVQIHTGQMGGIRNRVDKANAVHLASALELHRNVKFDLLHGNWPYMGDLLFLGKNYPNVSLNLAWLYMLDPIYAGDLLKRCLVAIPHSKVHGFGGDVILGPELAAAQLEICRQVVTRALADTVEVGWMEEAQALTVASDWLYNNPNSFYNLGLPRYEVMGC